MPSALSAPPPRLADLATLEPHQSHIRQRFGLPAHDPQALRRIAEFYQPPAWAVGCISIHDAAFIYDFVRALRPDRVVELGVASGGSTALLLRAIADSGLSPTDDRGVPRLQSFDLHPFCYFDRARPVGSAVQDMCPELSPGLALHTRKTASDAAMMLAPNSVPLAFIDADHRHPAPTADLLALLPALAPGGWVILHDIALAQAARRAEQKYARKMDYADQHGPEWLFEHWPHEKIRGGSDGRGLGATNIGAIRLPNGTGPALQELEPLLARPWEMRPDARAMAALGH